MTNRTVSLISFILFAVYTICCILLVTVGIMVYRNIGSQSASGDNMRLSLGYVANKLRSNDIANSVSIEKRDGTDMLVLKYEGEDDCETLVYWYDGYLYEMFKFTDNEIEPQYGTKLCALDRFDMALDGSRISFRANDAYGHEMEMSYALMSAQGE